MQKCSRVFRTYYSHQPKKQETPLPQRDRATRYVRRNLVNCCTAVRIITFERLEVRMTLKIAQDHRNCLY